MPLTLIEAGKTCRVRAVGGSDAVRRHLGDMGFVAGATVAVVSEAAGGLIVGVCGTRVALDADLARRILV